MRVARDSRGVRPAVDLAGEGVRRVGGRAVHPLVRAWGTRVPGDALAWLHRRGCPRRMPAAPRRPCGPARSRSRRSPSLVAVTAWVLAAVTGPALEVTGVRVRLPGRPPGAVRRRPHDPAGRAGRAARPERRGQDHARPAPERHPRDAAGSVRVGGLPVAKATSEGDPQAGRDRVPGPRRSAVHAHGARGRRVRPGQPRRPGDELDACVMAALDVGRDGGVRRPPAAPPQLRAAPARRRGDGAGDAAGDPRPRRAVLQPRPGRPSRAGRHPAVASTSRC